MRKVLGIGAVVFGIALSLAILPGDASAFGHRRGCCGGCGGCGCGYSYNTGCGGNLCCSNFYFNGCSTCGVSSCAGNTVFLDQGAAPTRPASGRPPVAAGRARSSRNRPPA